MLRKNWRMSSTILASFVSGFILALVVSCGKGPKVTVYISDPDANGMEYYNENTGTSGFVPYSSTDKFFCLNETDTQTLLNYCGVKQ